MAFLLSYRSRGQLVDEPRFQGRQWIWISFRLAWISFPSGFGFPSAWAWISFRPVWNSFRLAWNSFRAGWEGRPRRRLSVRAGAGESLPDGERAPAADRLGSILNIAAECNPTTLRGPALPPNSR